MGDEQQKEQKESQTPPSGPEPQTPLASPAEPVRDAGPRKILEALEKDQDTMPASLLPSPVTEKQAPKPPEPAGREGYSEMEMLVPESMRKLEQILKVFKEKQS